MYGYIICTSLDIFEYALKTAALQTYLVDTFASVSMHYKWLCISYSRFMKRAVLYLL